MRRFFIVPEAVQAGRILLSGELAHHIGHVLRMAVGDEATFADGCGHIYHGRIAAFAQDAVLADILSVTTTEEETAAAVTIYQGMPKGDKLELVIQKCTELGASRIVPVLCKRSVVKPNEGKSAKKVQRWQKIAQEASQQAKRLTVPQIAEPCSWQQMLGQIAESDLTIVLWEDEETQGFKALLESTAMPKQVNLIIGPEGGLDAAEVAQIKALGGRSASLGKRILRTETAALAALAMLFYHTGDLG